VASPLRVEAPNMGFCSSGKWPIVNYYSPLKDVLTIQIPIMTEGWTVQQTQVD